MNLRLDRSLEGSLAARAAGRVLVIDAYRTWNCGTWVGDMTVRWQHAEPAEGFVAAAPVEGVPVFVRATLPRLSTRAAPPYTAADSSAATACASSSTAPSCGSTGWTGRPPGRASRRTGIRRAEPRVVGAASGAAQLIGPSNGEIRTSACSPVCGCRPIIDDVTARSTQSMVRGRGSGRQRVLDAAYELFASQGARGVGVDAVVERAGTAKMTLYRHFATKDELVCAVLDRRDELWTDRLFAEAELRGDGPGERLVAIFSVLDEWFRDPEFDGCTFITTLVGAWPDGGSTLESAADHLDRIHARVLELARQTGATRPDQLAWHWSLLMRGAIVSAQAGHREAALLARDLAVASLAAALPHPESQSGVS